MSGITNLNAEVVYSRPVDYYKETFNELIVQSTFTVDLMKDGFVLPNGDLVETQQWCHNHIAWQFIRDYSENRSRDIRKTKSEIEYLESKSERSQEENYKLEKFHRDLVILEESKDYLELYERLNKSKGYDAAEFVVIYFGFLGISEHHLVYNKKNVNSIQCRKVGCGFEYENGGKVLIK